MISEVDDSVSPHFIFVNKMTSDQDRAFDIRNKKQLFGSIKSILIQFSSQLFLLQIKYQRSTQDINGHLAIS